MKTRRMNQSTILKKKGLNLNNAQSPLKNVNTFKIKREHVVNERSNKAKKEHVPIGNNLVLHI